MRGNEFVAAGLAAAGHKQQQQFRLLLLKLLPLWSLIHVNDVQIGPSGHQQADASTLSLSMLHCMHSLHAAAAAASHVYLCVSPQAVHHLLAWLDRQLWHHTTGTGHHTGQSECKSTLQPAAACNKASAGSFTYACTCIEFLKQPRGQLHMRFTPPPPPHTHTPTPTCVYTHCRHTDLPAAPVWHSSRPSAPSHPGPRPQPLLLLCPCMPAHICLCWPTCLSCTLATAHHEPCTTY